MALYTLRLRRTITSVSSLINHHRSLPTLPSTSASSPSSSLLQTFISSSSQPFPSLPLQSRLFRSSSVSLSSARSFNNRNDDDKIDPDTILFEGCDYNHWLITMDFPKDPKPTAEEMVETYVQTCAKGLNISIEEAKQKIYACSTTTFQGFQAEMTEQESEQFRGLPGVVFILPDSYIDPVNKEYGGDKYINGTIIPRPPPVQYGRNQQRNRNFDRPRYDRQGNPPYNQQGPMQGDGRNYGPPQYPQQNNGPTAQGDRRGPMPTHNAYNAPEGRGSFQGERRDAMPSHQGNYNQADQRRFAPPEQRDFRGDNRSYAPPHGPHGGNPGQGAGGPYGQGPGAQGQGGGKFGQGVGGSYGQGAGSQGVGASYGQGAGSQGVGGSYGLGAGLQGVGGSYGQGTGSQGVGGSYGQGAGSQGVGASYGQGTGSQGVGGSYGQGTGSQGVGGGVGGSYGQGTGSQGVGGSYGQGASSQGVGASYGQGVGSQGVGASYGQGVGSQGVGASYGQRSGSQGVGAPYGQGSSSQGVVGSYGQGAGSQGVGESYEQGADSGYGRSYPGQGEGQRVPLADQRNYGQTGTDHGRQ